MDWLPALLPQGLLLIMRAIHTLAAATWVGGSMMYLLVVQPALRLAPAPELAAKIAARFRRLVNGCVGLLLVSGAFLTVDRLTETDLGWPYVLTLSLKIALALCLFALAFYLGQSPIRRLARRSSRFAQVAPRLMLALGVVVFALGALLNILFEASLTSR
ncbi:CopD family protein [Thermogemmatispora sp.]|uniref:CopD family protein n=1 Tax=Thermogemmatispora sp. TaxID=1968838 RepID=UPI0035E4594B